METRRNYVEPIPFAIVGVALGLITLGTGWTLFNNPDYINFDATWVPKLTMALAALFVLLGIIKMASDPKWFWEKLLKDPINSSHFAVFPMVLMSIGEFTLGYQTGAPLNPTHSGAAYVIGMIFWYVGLLIGIAHFLFWVVMKFKTFRWMDVDGSWYVPPVGIAAACAINPLLLGGENYITFLQILWYIILVLYIIFSVIIWYRYFFIVGHPTELPAMGILTSVHSLMLVTYYFDFIEVKKNDHPAIMYILGAFSLVVTVLMYITMLKTFRARFFNPGLAGYTFPLAVSAVARVLFANYIFTLTAGSAGQELFKVFQWWAFIELIIATIVFAYNIVGMTYLMCQGYLKLLTYRQSKKNEQV